MEHHPPSDLHHTSKQRSKVSGMAAKIVAGGSAEHVVLTGSPGRYPFKQYRMLCRRCEHYIGVGKTTLVCRVCEVVRERRGVSSVQGFYTQEVREEVKGRGRGRRTGFDVVTFDGKRGPLARVDRYKGHHIITIRIMIADPTFLVPSQHLHNRLSIAPLWANTVSIFFPLSPLLFQHCR